MTAFAVSIPLIRPPIFSRSSAKVFGNPLPCLGNKHARIFVPKRRRPAPRMLLDVPKNSLTVLIVGSGGREHALVTAIAQSPYIETLLAAPGSDAIANSPSSTPIECLPIPADNIDEIIALAKKRDVHLVVVGPEVPLVAGLVDRLKEEGILAFGPTASGAILEGSKVFTKAFMSKYGIPSAWYQAFEDSEKAKAFVDEKGVPIVIKADGLAAGKGVIIANTHNEAYQAIDDILVEKRFGAAGNSVVVEEFLVGEELSFFALLDGHTCVPMTSAQDHKKAYDGDLGPNTGGMGAYSPAPFCDDKMSERVMNEVVVPTMKGLKAEGREFVGVLYCGLMISKGDMKVLEYNVRFGDPECQVLVERMQSDMLEVLYRTAKGDLRDFKIEWKDSCSVVVVMATRGYPGAYEKGSRIRNIGKAEEEGVRVYHAGTKLADGEYVANGGRVLGVTASGATVWEAKEKAYRGIEKIEWDDGIWRTDIGWRAVERELVKDSGGVSQ